jgi:integrase
LRRPAGSASRRGSRPDDGRGVAAYVLPYGTLPRPTRYVPHIYTDSELAAFFARTDRCHYCAEVPVRHLVMPVLFRTIYGCGLRACEARLLRVADVDLHTGVLLSVQWTAWMAPQTPAMRWVKNPP